MKLQPLYDLQQEITRLFVAGSKFAISDPRLLKHVTVLNKLGEKAPVFKKLASDLEDLTKTDAQQSSEKLLSISTLLYSILYTQGEMTEENVEEKQIEPIFNIADVITDNTYLQLKPVIEALTNSNSGRLEVLKTAYKQNVFNDFRIFQYVDLALGDKYGEMVNYLQETIIPSIGGSMIPLLLHSFAYDDRPQNVRRLRSLGQLQYKDIRKMCDHILSEKLPNMQAEVINILAQDQINEELIIKLANDKNKTVREASYRALAKLNTQKSLEKLKDIYINNKRNSDLPAIAEALSTIKMPFYFDEVFREINHTFEAFISLDVDAEDKKIATASEKLNTVLPILQNKDYPEVYNFLSGILTNKKFDGLTKNKKSSLSYNFNASDTMRIIISCFNTLDPKKTLDTYINLAKEISDTDWKYPFWETYFKACVNAKYTKEKIYDAFSEQYKKNIINTTDIYRAYAQEDDYNTFVLHSIQLDSRWIPLLFKVLEGKIESSNTYNLSCTLDILNMIEPNDSKRFNDQLIQVSKKIFQLPKYNHYKATEVFELMIKREIPNSFEQIYSILSEYLKSSGNYSSYFVKSDVWSKFPKEYAPKFRELYNQQKLNTFNEIADKIENQ